VKVSVVLTVYNATWCVERALDSALSQTLPPHEVLVCDDGSTDGTPELIENTFGSRVTVLRLPHKNASATRSVGLARATGDWLAFMDADDTWMKNKLERQHDYLVEHPEVRHLSTDGIFVSPDGVLRESWLSDYFKPPRELRGDLVPLLVERCFILMSSVLVERGIYHEVGGIDPNIVYSHDYDLWLRVGSRVPMAVMNERLITYFTSPGALSRRYEARHRDNLAIMRKLERGEYRKDPQLMRRGAERAAALEYDLGLICLRTGRIEEGRAHLRRAAAAGPATRRLLAAAAGHAPGWVFPALRRAHFLKGPVQESRASKAYIDDDPVERRAS
jgi:glycosyltransferase involved in cell wall biosynthesis